mgnify:CR=1 FL=1
MDDGADDGDIACSIVTAAATRLRSQLWRPEPDRHLGHQYRQRRGGNHRQAPRRGSPPPRAGGTATVQHRAHQPAEPASVSIGLSSTDTAEGTVAPASVTFTTGNWNTAQTVTVTGVDDPVVDGPVGYTITTAAATSGDGQLQRPGPDNVSVTNNDNDAVGITVSPTSGPSPPARRAAPPRSRSFSPACPPPTSRSGCRARDVTGGQRGSPASVTFTTGNWSVPRTVTVAGVDDAILDGPVGYTIITAAADQQRSGIRRRGPAQRVGDQHRQRRRRVHRQSRRPAS